MKQLTKQKYSKFYGCIFGVYGRNNSNWGCFRFENDGLGWKQWKWMKIKLTLEGNEE